jgi:hypothetical protein
MYFNFEQCSVSKSVVTANNHQLHNAEDANVNLEAAEVKTCGCSAVPSSHIPPPVDIRLVMHVQQYIQVTRHV